MTEVRWSGVVERIMENYEKPFVDRKHTIKSVTTHDSDCLDRSRKHVVPDDGVYSALKCVRLVKWIKLVYQVAILNLIYNHNTRWKQFTKQSSQLYSCERSSSPHWLEAPALEPICTLWGRQNSLSSTAIKLHLPGHAASGSVTITDSAALHPLSYNIQQC
jgi:hypothetical protein